MANVIPAGPEPSGSEPSGSAPTDYALSLSYTRISVWQECRLRYRFQYVDHVPTRTTPAMFTGRVVHAALEGFLTQPLAARNPAQLEPLFRHLWAGADDRHTIFTTRAEEGFWGRKALRMLSTFLARDAWAEPEAVEQWVELPLSGGLRVNGRIDRLDRGPEGLHVIDYKTGRAKSAAELAADLQPSIYAWLVQEVLGEPVRRTTFWFLGGDARVEVPVAAEQLAALPAWFEATGQAILQEQEYPARPGRHCRTCDFLDRCIAGQKARGRQQESAPSH